MKRAILILLLVLLSAATPVRAQLANLDKVTAS
jgi:hypothetical protein